MVKLPGLFEKKTALYMYDDLSKVQAIIGMDLLSYGE
jgi:hypothetical protein